MTQDPEALKAFDDFNAEQTAMYHRLADEAAESPTQADSLVTFKPMVSNALRVHPKQVKEAMDFAKSKGVPTEYQPDGKPVITSSRQFRELAKINGMRHEGY